MSGESPNNARVRAAQAECERLAAGFAQLVVESEGRDSLPGLSALAAALATHCRSRGLEYACDLARALSRGTDLLYKGQIDPGQALPLLAAGTLTLQKALSDSAPVPSENSAELGIRAAQYELETLFPNADEEPKQIKGGPDVSLHRLRTRLKGKSS